MKTILYHRWCRDSIEWLLSYRKIILRSWCLTSGIDHYHRKEWMIIPYCIFSVAASLTLGWWMKSFSLFSFFKEGVRKKDHFAFLGFFFFSLLSISFSHKRMLVCIFYAHLLSLIWQTAVDFLQRSVCSHHATYFLF
jgi:hypothetical protein